MKTTESTFRAHLDGDVTALCTCWEIRRKDGAVLRFTDSDEDVTRDGVIYQSIGAYSRSAIESTASLSVDNLEVSGMATDLALPVEQLRAGAYDHAEVEVFMTSWLPTVEGKLKLRRGFFGEVSVLPNGTFTVELRGLFQRIANTYTDVFSATCRHDLGDSGCKIDLSHPYTDEGAHIPIRFADANFEEVGRVGMGASATWYNPVSDEELIDSGSTYSGVYAAHGSAEGAYLVQDIDLYRMSEDFQTHVDQGDVGFNAYAWRKDEGGQGRIRYRFLDSDFRQLRQTSGSYYNNNFSINIQDVVETGDWTIEAWVRPYQAFTRSGNPSRKGEFFGYTNSNQTRVRALGIEWTSNTLSYVTREDIPNTMYIYAPFSASEAFEWTHVALVRTGPKTLIFYVDGTEVLRQETDSTAQADLYVGDIGGSFISNFDGEFDEVRIWSEARSSRQINQFRFRDIETPPESLQRYYPFDGDTEDKSLNETGSVSSGGGVLLTDYTPVATSHRGIETELDTGFQDVGTDWVLAGLETPKVPMHCRTIRMIFDYQGAAGAAESTRMDSVFGWFRDGSNVVPMPNFEVGENDAVWSRAGMVTTGGNARTFNATIDEPRKENPGWFQGGLVTFFSGKNAGASMEVKRWTAESGQIELFLSLPYPVEQGDLFTIYPGCDKSRVCCVALFENIENFFGTPDVPGEDELFMYPDYKE